MVDIIGMTWCADSTLDFLPTNMSDVTSVMFYVKNLLLHISSKRYGKLLVM